MYMYNVCPKCDEQMKGKNICMCTVWCAELQSCDYYKIEYVNLNTNQTQQSQSMFIFIFCLCFCSLFSIFRPYLFSFVSLIHFFPLSLSAAFIAAIVFIRSRFCNLISRLKLAIVVHIHITYNSSSTIVWQNDRFLCVPLLLILSLLLLLLSLGFFFGSHSFQL